MQRKIRVNITVDREALEKAKTKLRLFGGKLSTLFDAYLCDFIASMEQDYGAEQKAVQQKIQELETRIERLERQRPSYGRTDQREKIKKPR